MISPKAYFTEIYPKLPPLMKQILGSDRILNSNLVISERFHFGPEQSKILVSNEISIIGQEYKPADLYQHLKDELELDPTTAERLTVEVLGRVVLPMEWYVGNAQVLIQKYGGDVNKYLAEAHKLYPEVYQPQETAPAVVETKETQPIRLVDSQTILNNFDERLTNFRGRAEVLLRLTGVGAEIEQAMESGKITKEEAEGLLSQLNSTSAAINTKDLNPLEIQALRRSVQSVLEKIDKDTK